MSGLWPLFGLCVTTAQLTLAPVRDDDLDELAAPARKGIHASDAMPFSNLWTERRGAAFDRGFAQYFWRQRARWSPEAWSLPFAVRWNGRAIGIQQVSAPTPQ